MARRFAKITLLCALFFSASCSAWTWKGKAGVSDPEAAKLGVVSVAALEREYDTQRYWAFWRNNIAGKGDAILDGLHNIHRSLDRHFFNHTWGDPFVRR